MKTKYLFIFTLILLFFKIDPAFAYNQSEKEFQKLLKWHTSVVAPLEKEMNITDWNAYISGKKEDYAKKSEAASKLDRYYSNHEVYAKLKAFEESGKIKNKDLNRALHLMLNAFGPKQIPDELLTKISQKESQLQRVFNNYRGEIDGKKVNDAAIYEILKNSTDRNQRKAAWEAQKGVGPLVAADLIELVKLRNTAARKLGFKNYYEMTVSFQDFTVEELESIFDKLVESTETPFLNYKKQLDEITAKKLSIAPDKLQPWDYTNPFFQSSEAIFAASNDSLYKDRNLPLVDYNFYGGMGLSLENVLKNSDLYPKEGKSQHAFCYTMDRGHDVRILMNLTPTETAFSTLLHESGHAVYSLGIDPSLPWIYRTEAHIFATEAIAMFFERMNKNPDWLVNNLGADRAKVEKAAPLFRKDQNLSDLLFCRWTVVMFHFEKSLYENPDQDLNKLWWELVEKYQHLQKPADRNLPDWASKIHLVSAPVYYHNYMLGSIMVSQLLHKLGTDVVKAKDWKSIDLTGNKDAGRWIKNNIFRYGCKYRWNELLTRATGESLNPEYFAESIK